MPNLTAEIIARYQSSGWRSLMSRKDGLIELLIVCGDIVAAITKAGYQSVAIAVPTSSECSNTLFAGQIVQ